MSIYLNLSLPTLWLAAHYQTVLWLFNKVEARPDALLLLSIVIVVIGYTFSKVRFSTHTSTEKSPLVLFLTVATFSVINSHTIDFYQLHVTFFLLGMYAWLGLQASIWHKWQKLLNIAILLSLAVPFYLEFSSGLGFGLRVATASLVEQTLNALGFHAVSSHDIIIIENSIAHIDIPCSGLKSLWVGSAFYLAALVVLGKRMSWNVLWKYILVIFLLLSANTFRILILTLLTSLYNMPYLAEMLHLPLGILGFALSCLAGWFLLRYVPETNKTLSQPSFIRPQKWIICLFMLFFLQLFSVKSEKHDTVELSIESMPILASVTESIPLTSQEQRYFSRGEETVAGKWRFEWKGNSGSMLLVQSRDFNMFHAPELCMVAGGVKVDSMRTLQIGENHFRLLSLNQGSATGIYWLQSGDHATDDFTSRYLQYILSKKKKWSMISMILQTPYSPNNIIVENLIKANFENGTEKDNDEMDTFTE